MVYIILNPRRVYLSWQEVKQGVKENIQGKNTSISIKKGKEIWFDHLLKHN